MTRREIKRIVVLPGGGCRVDGASVAEDDLKEYLEELAGMGYRFEVERYCGLVEDHTLNRIKEIVAGIW